MKLPRLLLLHERSRLTATSQKAKTTDHSSKYTAALLGKAVVAAQCAKKDASAIAVINESSSSATKRSKEFPDKKN